MKRFLGVLLGLGMLLGLAAPAVAEETNISGVWWTDQLKGGDGGWLAVQVGEDAYALHLVNEVGAKELDGLYKSSISGTVDEGTSLKLWFYDGWGDPTLVLIFIMEEEPYTIPTSQGEAAPYRVIDIDEWGEVEDGPIHDIRELPGHSVCDIVYATMGCCTVSGLCDHGTLVNCCYNSEDPCVAMCGCTGAFDWPFITYACGRCGSFCSNDHHPPEPD